MSGLGGTSPLSRKPPQASMGRHSRRSSASSVTMGRHSRRSSATSVSESFSTTTQKPPSLDRLASRRMSQMLNIAFAESQLGGGAGASGRLSRRASLRSSASAPSFGVPKKKRVRPRYHLESIGFQKFDPSSDQAADYWRDAQQAGPGWDTSGSRERGDSSTSKGPESSTRALSKLVKPLNICRPANTLDERSKVLHHLDTGRQEHGGVRCSGGGGV